MKHTVVIALLIAAPVFYAGVKFGQARARALRAWRDYQATKAAIVGLFRRTFDEWAKVVKVGVVAGVVVLVGIVVVFYG